MADSEENKVNDNKKKEAQKVKLELKGSKIFRSDLDPIQKKKFLEDLIQKYDFIIKFLDDKDEVNNAMFSKEIAKTELERVKKSIELNKLDEKDHKKDEGSEEKTDI